MGMFKLFTDLAEQTVADDMEVDRVKDAHRRSRETISSKAQLRYAEAFKEPTTIAAASNEMGIEYMTCLTQAYRYEKRGLIRRTGQVARGRASAAILWEWIK